MGFFSLPVTSTVSFCFSIHVSVISFVSLRRLIIIGSDEIISLLVVCLHILRVNRVLLYNNIIIMCIFIYRTYHLSSHGGLQFLLKGNQINIIQITNLQLSFYKSDQIKSNVGFW